MTLRSRSLFLVDPKLPLLLALSFEFSLLLGPKLGLILTPSALSSALDLCPQPEAQNWAIDLSKTIWSLKTKTRAHASLRPHTPTHAGWQEEEYSLDDMIEDLEMTKTASVASCDSDGLGPESSSSVSSPSRVGMCMSVRLSMYVCYLSMCVSVRLSKYVCYLSMRMSVRLSLYVCYLSNVRAGSKSER